MAADLLSRDQEAMANWEDLSKGAVATAYLGKFYYVPVPKLLLTSAGGAPTVCAASKLRLVNFLVDDSRRALSHAVSAGSSRYAAQSSRRT